MRDIRDDLRERIKTADKEMNRLHGELIELEEYVQSLKDLLAVEMSRHKGNGETADQIPVPTEDLDKFILRLVKRQSPTKQEITAAVQKAGYIKPGTAAGRVVHGKLLKMLNDKSVRLRAEKYEVVE